MRAHVGEWPVRVREPVVAQKVGLGTSVVGVEERGQRSAALHRVGEPRGHGFGVGGEMAAVEAEEALRCGFDVSGLEQAEDHREQRERGRIVVGTRDEAEHLDLALDGGAVVRDHVDEVVLSQERWRGLRMTGEREAARPVEAMHALTE